MSEQEKIMELEKQVEELKSYIFLLKPTSISPTAAMQRIRQECRNKYFAPWNKVRYGEDGIGPDGKAYADYEAWTTIIKKETDLLFKYFKGKANSTAIITKLISTEADLEEYQSICDRVCRDLREKIDQITGGGQICKA